MKRREILKASMLLACCGFSASCGKQKSVSDNDTLKIVPKQTDVYKFSAPLPFDYKTLDEMAEFNNVYKKSKLTTLYNNIPFPLASDFNEWLMVRRGENKDIKTFEDFRKYIKYAQKLGFKVCYLLNSLKPYSLEDYKSFKGEFHKLLDDIASCEIKEIKVANTQSAALVNEYNPNFELSASTTFEFHNVSQYINLLNNFPNIKLIDIAIGENQNFDFLANLRKLFPNVAIELMVNEGCIKTCPARISHGGSAVPCQFSFACGRLKNKNPMEYSFKNGTIYPWTLEYYSAIGINNFKLVYNNNGTDRSHFKDSSRFKHYLDCVEYGADSYSANDFFKEILYGGPELSQDIKISKFLPFLPDINHFIKYGSNCASACGTECSYCKIMAEKMDKFISELLNS